MHLAGRTPEGVDKFCRDQKAVQGGRRFRNGQTAVVSFNSCSHEIWRSGGRGVWWGGRETVGEDGLVPIEGRKLQKLRLKVVEARSGGGKREQMTPNFNEKARGVGMKY